MTETETTPPLILLDVDGPLNPYDAKPTRRPPGYRTHRLKPRDWPGNPLRVWLNPNHGELLLALAEDTGAELAWCSAWLDEANTLIAPRVGLPELPVVPWTPGSGKWKWDAVLDYAGDRPLVWFDDDFSFYEQEQNDFIATRLARDLRTLLREVSPKKGLTFEDVLVASQWLRGIH